MNSLPLALRRPLQIAVPSLLAVLLLTSPALAHHPFGMGDSAALTPLQGLFSGIGHPPVSYTHLTLPTNREV